MPAETKSEFPARPRLAIRVGITGTRKLDALRENDPSQLRWIEERIDEILKHTHDDVETIAKRESVTRCYGDGTGPVTPHYWFLSPLAEGADRLAARAALKAGFQLIVPMPFRQDIYEEDFSKTPGSLDEFHDLLENAKGTAIELDGARDEQDALTSREARSYEAVGRFVARNCDILIAVWDGCSRDGRGGTFDTLRFATEIGVPVWWVHASAKAGPVWLTDPVEPAIARDVQPPLREVTAYLTSIIEPPKPPPPESEGARIEWLVGVLRRDTKPAHLQYLEEPEPKFSLISHAHAIFIRVFSWPPACDNKSGDSEHQRYRAPYWYDHQTAPDIRSVAFANRYRSVYVLIFALTAMSLLLAATPLLEPAHDPHSSTGMAPGWHIPERVLKTLHPVAIVAEVIAIGVILGLVVMNTAFGWHRRWIDYRVLAELFREQGALAPLGWALPRASLAALTESREDPVDADPPRRRWRLAGHKPKSGADRSAWLAWFHGAIARAAPLRTGSIRDRLGEARTAILDDLVLGQIAYHEHRRGLYKSAERRLVRGGELLFLLVLILTVGKFCALASEHHAHEWVEFLAIALPTLAAGFLGIRHYAELELLVQQSEHMIRFMKRAKERLSPPSLDLEQPLASQDLGAIGLGVSIEMLKETDSWLRLFRVKVVEAG